MKGVNKMEDLDCIVATNQNNNKITITGLKNDVVLDYADDIDFTDLISELAVLIDEDKTVKLSYPEAKDEKEKLILKTINGIFEKYNKCQINGDATEEK